ncbi:MAG: aminotransferase class I/II-fold pyridoxal phosphate-dependent enzyme, partial [Chloroflexi bacterium]|nr:aminotransferase class I/II-fold pyridoxal phosphate-dependent enzyme [Chloroflexota bacterium]
MSISDRVKKSMEQGSWIRRMFEEGVELKKQYGAENIFDLSLGNPVIEPPVQFFQELKRLAQDQLPGMHRYMENAGYTKTRADVAAHLSSETGVNFTVDDIVMTCGAAGALNVILRTVLNAGDEVVIFAPYFAEYTHYIANFYGIAKILPSDEQFVPRLDVLEKEIGPKTRIVLLNSPNNPSGAVYSDRFLHQLGQLLVRKSGEYGEPIILINDEPYRRLVYDGGKCPHIWPHYEQSIIVTSHSKDLALPGERIGY